VKRNGSALKYAHPAFREDPLLISWANLTRPQCNWRKCREWWKGRSAAWWWVEWVAMRKETRRIARANHGFVWEEEEREESANRLAKRPRMS
jgi:hypothetical protein